MQIITNRVLIDAKEREDSECGIKIQIEYHLTPILAKKKQSKMGKIPDLVNFRQLLGHKGGQILFDLTFGDRFGILSLFSLP